MAGDRAFAMSPAMNGDAVDERIYSSPTIDTKTGEIFIKLVNAEAVDKVFTVQTGTGLTYEATLEFVSSHDTSIKNQGDQNYYSSHPDYAAPRCWPRRGRAPGPPRKGLPLRPPRQVQRAGGPAYQSAGRGKGQFRIHPAGECHRHPAAQACPIV